MRGDRLADNIAYFARTLRAAGVPVGPGRVIDAVKAVASAGIGRREDFFYTLRAALVSRREDLGVFDVAFRLFWRRGGLQDKLAALLSPPAIQHTVWRPAHRRVTEALFSPRTMERAQKTEEVKVEARLVASTEDVLRTKDFAQMSAEELAAARLRIAALRMNDSTRTRRLVRDPRGRYIDARASLRRGVATGGDLVPLVRRGPKRRPPPLVALLDISGSMAEYSRTVLLFLHTLGRVRGRVSTFLFGTRLTNVTRALSDWNVDTALAHVAATAGDWSGGTRIAASLHAFNQDWSRRVLGQGAVVLLITDGLERGEDASLAFEIDRLRRSCQRLVWLNPLLRYEGFEPRARGIRTLLAHVDDFRPVHNLASLESLVEAFSAKPVKRRPGPARPNAYKAD